MRPFRTKNLFSRPAHEAFGLTVDDPAQESARRHYLSGLRSYAPINWLSAHLKEDQSDFGPVFIALKVLMAQAASARVRVYRWRARAGSEDEKEYLPRDHPICRLLRRPNRWDSGRTLRARAVQQRSLTGTWLGWRVDEGPPWTGATDRPVEIWTVPTGTYTAVPLSPQYPNGAYRIMPFYPGPMALLPGTWQAGGVIVPADQMLVSQHPHPLVYKEGLSPLSACGEELDTVSKIGRARKSIMSRAPVPTGVLELDTGAIFPDDSELKRLTAQIYNYLGGPDRAGRPAILGPGQHWKPYDIAGLELPWGDTWDQLLDFVFAVLGTTRTMVGMKEATSYAALYAILKQNRLTVLQPELDDIADCFNTQLIEPFWGEEYGCEFEPEAVGDDELQEKQLALDLRAGVRTFNEWRQLRRLAPVAGPKGQEWVKGGGKPGGAGLPGEGAERERSLAHPRELDGPADPMDAGWRKPRNAAGRGSLPPRLDAILRRDVGNLNGKPRDR
jgi:hypothetical protein